MKIYKKKIGSGGGGGRVREVGLGGQGRCERRSEVYVKIKKKKIGGVGVSGLAGSIWVGGQGCCERRSEIFVRKKMGGWGVGSGRGVGLGGEGGVKEELKFL